MYNGVYQGSYNGYKEQPNKYPNNFLPSYQYIERDNTKNTGNVMHNNLGVDLKIQNYYTYHLTVSSNDRDTTLYPSPFKFTIFFGNNSRAPQIPRKFTNIREFIFDSIILPRTIAIDTTNAGIAPYNLYPTSSTYVSPTAATPTSKLYDLANFPWLNVKLTDLKTDSLQGSSSRFNENTFRIFLYQTSGLDGTLWRPERSSNDITYPFSKLNNLDQLTFELYDPNNNLIQLRDKNGNPIIGTDISGTTNDYNEHIEANKTVDSIIYTNMVTQIILNFTLKITEIELSTKPTFNGS